MILDSKNKYYIILKIYKSGQKIVHKFELRYLDKKIYCMEIFTNIFVPGIDSKIENICCIR